MISPILIPLCSRGSVSPSQGSVFTGNNSGDKSIKVSLGTIPGKGSATVSFEVTINNPLSEPTLANQASVTGTNFSSVKSDNPGTPQIGDATIIFAQISPPIHGPGISQGGIAGLAILLGGAMVWVIRRRQIRGKTG